MMNAQEYKSNRNLFFPVDEIVVAKFDEYTLIEWAGEFIFSEWDGEPVSRYFLVVERAGQEFAAHELKVARFCLLASTYARIKYTEEVRQADPGFTTGEGGDPEDLMATLREWCEEIERIALS